MTPLWIGMLQTAMNVEPLGNWFWVDTLTNQSYAWLVNVNVTKVGAFVSEALGFRIYRPFGQLATGQRRYVLLHLGHIGRYPGHVHHARLVRI